MSKDETSVVDEMTEVIEETTEVEESKDEPTKATEPNVEETKADAKDPSQNKESSETIDYKAEAEKWRQKFEKEHEVKENLRVANSKKADLIKQLNKEFNGEEPAEETDGADIEQKIFKALTEYKRQENLDSLDKRISAMTDDADEAAAIKVIYENKINHSGYSEESIEEDLQLAQILANRARYEKKAEEKVRKSIAQEQALKGSTTEVKSTVKEPSKKRRVSRDEREFLKFLEAKGYNLKKYL